MKGLGNCSATAELVHHPNLLTPCLFEIFPFNRSRLHNRNCLRHYSFFRPFRVSDNPNHPLRAQTILAHFIQRMSSPLIFFRIFGSFQKHKSYFNDLRLLHMQEMQADYFIGLNVSPNKLNKVPLQFRDFGVFNYNAD